MGRVGKQPPGALLRADQGGPQAARGRSREVGAPVCRRQPRAAKDITVRLFHILQSRLRSILFRDRRESDLSEELQLHLDREIERLEASGLSHEEALLQAGRLFGGVEQLKEECRDARGTGAWDALVRDTRQGLR